MQTIDAGVRAYPTPLGWAPSAAAWRTRLARRLVWELCVGAAGHLLVSSHLRVRLGRANERRPLVAVTVGPVDPTGLTRSPPCLVVDVGADPRAAAWWHRRGTAEVWQLRADGAGLRVAAGSDPRRVSATVALAHASEPSLRLHLAGLIR